MSSTAALGSATKRLFMSITSSSYAKRPRTSLLSSLLSFTLEDRIMPSMLTGYSAVELISLFAVKLR